MLSFLIPFAVIKSSKKEKKKKNKVKLHLQGIAQTKLLLGQVVSPYKMRFYVSPLPTEKEKDFTF